MLEGALKAEKEFDFVLLDTESITKSIIRNKLVDALIIKLGFYDNLSGFEVFADLTGDDGKIVTSGTTPEARWRSASKGSLRPNLRWYDRNYIYSIFGEDYRYNGYGEALYGWSENQAIGWTSTISFVVPIDKLSDSMKVKITKVERWIDKEPFKEIETRLNIIAIPSLTPLKEPLWNEDW